MIIGYVRDYLPHVTLGVRSDDRAETAIEFILDTGFDGDLTLPSAVIDRLDAVYLGERVLRLADGSVQQRPFYEIELDWDGTDRPAEVHVLENPPLLGATLLDGYAVTLEMTPDGTVTIEPL